MKWIIGYLLLSRSLKKLNVKKVGMINNLSKFFLSLTNHKLERLKCSQEMDTYTDDTINAYLEFLQQHPKINKYSIAGFGSVYKGAPKLFGKMVEINSRVVYLKINSESKLIKGHIKDLKQPISNLSSLVKMCMAVII